MTLTFSVDWINYTALELGTRVLSSVPYPIADQQWEPNAPSKGYNNAIQNKQGCKVSWHNKRDDMGVHVQYSGSCLNNYAIVGATSKMIAEHHLASHDRCTRIDLALDVRDEKLIISKLASIVKYGSTKVKTKSYSHIISQDGGETLYLGSRQSEQYLRIYNKAAQQEIDGDWVRIELELKGSRAHQIGAQVAIAKDLDMTAITRGLIKNLADFDESVWQRVVGDMAVSIAKAQVNEPDTKGWLLGSVAPAMGRYIRETDDQAIVEQFLAIVDSFVRFG
jgi:DNA relaxase NicK